VAVLGYDDLSAIRRGMPNMGADHGLHPTARP